jgi:hypothetical protein
MASIIIIRDEILKKKKKKTGPGNFLALTIGFFRFWFETRYLIFIQYRNYRIISN